MCVNKKQKQEPSERGGKEKSEISRLLFFKTMILTKVFKGSDQLLKIRGCGNECMMYCAFFFLHIFFVLPSLYIVSNIVSKYK